MQITTESVEQTEGFGRALAARLQPGDVIAYTGDLGAGKTALTRGIAAGLGIEEPVLSPTYTIVNEYRSGRLPLFHGCRCSTSTCTASARRTNCLRSAGRTIWPRAACAQWSGVKMCRSF